MAITIIIIIIIILVSSPSPSSSFSASSSSLSSSSYLQNLFSENDGPVLQHNGHFAPECKVRGGKELLFGIIRLGDLTVALVI